MSDKKYTLILAANPYMQVMYAECDDQGKPIVSTYYAPIKRTILVFDPHSSGGAWDAPATFGMNIIDGVPRTGEEAYAIASRCPAGKHYGPAMEMDDARIAVAEVEALMQSIA